MTPEELQKHIFNTYIHLRIGMIAIAFLFPLLLGFGGWWHGIEWQDSMSAYYFVSISSTAPPPMRVWFIGLLFALGVFLILYKGFSKTEDWCLNLAGIFAMGVALFPMPWPSDSGDGFSKHYFCAVSMFVCVAIVIWRCAGITVKKCFEEDRQRHFERRYCIAGWAMAILPILICLYGHFCPKFAKRYHQIFWLEAICIWVFAYYWRTKNRELKESLIDIDALKQKVSTDEEPQLAAAAKKGVASRFAPIVWLVRPKIVPARRVSRRVSE